MEKTDVKQPVYVFFYCSECKFKQRLRWNEEVERFLDIHLSSTGCCKGCGTQSWSVRNTEGLDLL